MLPADCTLGWRGECGDDWCTKKNRPAYGLPRIWTCPWTWKIVKTCFICRVRWDKLWSNSTGGGAGAVGVLLLWLPDGMESIHNEMYSLLIKFNEVCHLCITSYLCFDQITNNIWNTKYPQMWGENVRERNNQCSLRTLTISLPGLVQKGMRRLMVTCGGPETLSLCWLWAKKTLWIRQIPQSTRIIVPSRIFRTRSHSPSSLYSSAVSVYS